MRDLSQPFQVEDDGSVCRFTLPRRKLGELRRFAFIPLGLGVFGLLFIALWVATPMTQGLKMVRQGQVVGWFFAAFGLFGLIGLRITLLMIAGSIAALRDSTQCILEVRRKHLVSIEKFGWLKWRRKTALKDISKLSVGSAFKGRSSRGQEAMFLRFTDAECVVAHLQDKQFPVAVAYPRDLLVPLANQLAERLGRQLEKVERTADPVSGFARSTVGTEVDVRPRIAVDVADPETPFVPEKPAGSSIQCHEVNDSTVFEIPAMGVWKGLKGLAFFACFWNGFMVLFTTVSVFGMANGPGEGVIVFSIFIAVFWAIGIGLALAAINMGRRSTMIGIVGEGLFVKTKSIFGEKKQQVEFANLASIESGPSGMSVNDEAIYELQIQPRDGKKIGVLSQRSDDELKWLAHELRTRANLQQTPQRANWQNQVQAGNLVEPASGAITIEETINGKQINIPPAGWKKWFVLGLMSVIFTLVGACVMLHPIIQNVFAGNQPDLFDGAVNLMDMLFGFAFLAGGAAMFVGYRVATTRRFVILLARNDLTVERYGVLSRKTFTWPLEAIKHVDREQSSTEVNNVPLDELVITVPDDPGLTLMTGRPRDEIDFVAAHINLELPSTQQVTDQPQ